MYLLIPLLFSGQVVFDSLCHELLPIRWPKYWSFSISPSSEYSGLISFRIDWFDLLAVQGTLNSLLQHHSLKASVLQCSAFFMVQLSHPYMTTGKTIPLTRWTFVGRVISLLFSMLSRFVIAFLPRSKHLLVSWLQSLSAVILEPIHALIRRSTTDLAPLFYTMWEQWEDGCLQAQEGFPRSPPILASRTHLPLSLSKWQRVEAGIQHDCCHVLRAKQPGLLPISPVHSGPGATSGSQSLFWPRTTTSLP